MLLPEGGLDMPTVWDNTQVFMTQGIVITSILLVLGTFLAGQFLGVFTNVGRRLE